MEFLGNSFYIFDASYITYAKLKGEKKMEEKKTGAIKIDWLNLKAHFSPNVNLISKKIQSSVDAEDIKESIIWFEILSKPKIEITLNKFFAGMWSITVPSLMALTFSFSFFFILSFIVLLFKVHSMSYNCLAGKYTISCLIEVICFIISIHIRMNFVYPW